MTALILPAGMTPSTSPEHPSVPPAREFLRTVPPAFHNALIRQLAEGLESLPPDGASDEAAYTRAGLERLMAAYTQHSIGAHMADEDVLGLAWFVRDCADFYTQSVQELGDVPPASTAVN